MSRENSYMVHVSLAQIPIVIGSFVKAAERGGYIGPYKAYKAFDMWFLILGISCMTFWKSIKDCSSHVNTSLSLSRPTLRRSSFMIKTSFKRLSSFKITSSVQIVNPRLGTEVEFLLPNFLHIYIFPRSVVNAKMVFRNIVRSIMTVDSNLNQAVRISK